MSGGNLYHQNAWWQICIENICVKFVSKECSYMAQICNVKMGSRELTKL